MHKQTSHVESSYYRAIGFKIALLSLSLLTIMTGAGVAPGLAKIAEAFPLASETLIKQVVSLPPLFMIIAALLTGISGERLKPKTLILAGLTLYVIGGVGAGFVDSIGQILLFQAVLGFGAGIILAFSTGLIAACYQGAEKSRMMGLSFSANTLGAIIGNILAGILASIQWNYMFHIYWIGLIVLALAGLFLNELPHNPKPESKVRLPSYVFKFALCALLLMMVFFLIITNLALLIKQKELGTSQITGLLFAANSITMLAAGALLPFSLRLKRFFLPIVFFIISIGLFEMAQAITIPAMLASIILSGMGIGSLFPYLLNLFSENLLQSQTVKAMAVVMASAWFGKFLSPLFFNFVSYLTGFTTSLLFISVAAAFMILFVGSLVKNKQNDNKPFPAVALETKNRNKE